jgi:putative MATE family efflux protein
MAKIKNRDFLGTDDMKSLLIKLSVPALIAMLSNALYNLIDTIFVGRGVGTLAISALSIVFPLQMIIGAFALMFGVGAAAITSIEIGKKNNERAANASAGGITIAMIFGILIMTFCLIFLNPILRALGASDTILPMANEYGRIILMGLPFLTFAMVSNNLVRATGDANTAMKSMLIGTVSNTILDPIFIFALHLGIQGAAIATITSQVLSAMYVLHYFLKGHYSVHLKLENFKLRASLVGQTIVLGTATLVRQLGTSAIALVANNLLGTLSGDVAIAAFGVINRIGTVVLLPIYGLNQGVQPIIGYNMGAGKTKRIRECLRISIKWALTLGLIGEVILQLFPELLISMFGNDQELIKVAVPALRIYSAALIFVGIQSLGATYYQAIGRGIPSIILGLLRQFILLVPLMLILSVTHGAAGIWISFPISDSVSALITGIFLFIGVRKLPKDTTELKISDID